MKMLKQLGSKFLFDILLFVSCVALALWYTQQNSGMSLASLSFIGMIFLLFASAELWGRFIFRDIILRACHRWGLGLTTIAVLVYAFVTVSLPFPEVYRVYGWNMAPLLASGDLILVEKLWYRSTTLHEGDVIVYRIGDSHRISSIAATSGQLIEIRPIQQAETERYDSYIDGMLAATHIRQDCDHTQSVITTTIQSFSEFEVPPSYAVTIELTADRKWCTIVSPSDIEGKAVFAIWAPPIPQETIDHAIEIAIEDARDCCTVPYIEDLNQLPKWRFGLLTEDSPEISLLPFLLS